MPEQFEVFLTDEALRINKARQDHLAALGLQLAGKTVLEVGAGIGLHTQFFEDLGCSIVTTDGRPENVSEMRRRYPHRRARVLDLETTTDLTFLGTFDIIYCYGTLYHLSQPEAALKAMAQVCRELILLETCVTPGNTFAINSVSEDSQNPNQAYSGIGCRPTRPWVMATLKQYFGFAYVSKYQPCHPDFDLNWHQPLEKPLHRSVFVGSRLLLEHNKLLETLPDQQHTDPETRSSWLDIKANLEQATLVQTQVDPELTIYTFEPDPQVTSSAIEHTSNVAIEPEAIAKQDNLSLAEQASGVPTNRLDAVLNQLNIHRLDYLKMDAQTNSFDLIQTLGERIRNISKIQLEVTNNLTQTDANSDSKTKSVDYLVEQDFILIKVERLHEQTEQLTFVHQNYLRTLSSFDLAAWTDLNHQVEHLDPASVLAIAESLSYHFPIQPYPGWYFNIDWDSPKPQIQLRRSVWEYFKARQIEQSLQFNWHFELKVALYLANDLSSQLFIAGCYEPNEFYCLSRALHPGMTFLDIGANDGLYALFASRVVGSEGTVYAFEPSSREFERLQANIALNQISNIQAESIALANVNGNTELRLANNEHAGQNTLGQFIYEGVTSPQTETISVRRLDDWLAEANIQQIDVIKMDVEGAEFTVLQGAKQTLTTYHPLLLLELSDSALQAQGSNAQAVLEFLQALGYEILTFGQWTGLPINLSTLSTSGNVVAIHSDRTWSGLTTADIAQAMQLEIATAQAEIERLQQTLEHANIHLQENQVQTEQLQLQLRQTQADLKHVSLSYDQLETEAHQVHAELGKTQAELIEMHERLHQAEIGLFAAQAEWQKAREQISAMESSKFWQLRNRWLHLKRKLNLPTTD
jgi:FkbM family methyltransferase